MIVIKLTLIRSNDYKQYLTNSQWVVNRIRSRIEFRLCIDIRIRTRIQFFKKFLSN